MKKLRITIDGKPYDVDVQFLDEPQTTSAPAPAPIPRTAAPTPSAPVPAAKPEVAPVPSAGGPGDVASPLAGKIVSIDVQKGQDVKEGQQVVTLEAMKMNTYVNAPKAGKVSDILANPGDAVEEGQVLVRLS